MQYYEDVIDDYSYIHNLTRCEIKAWKIQALSGFKPHDLCNTCAVPSQLIPLQKQPYFIFTLWLF